MRTSLQEDKSRRPDEEAVGETEQLASLLPMSSGKQATTGGTSWTRTGAMAIASATLLGLAWVTVVTLPGLRKAPARAEDERATDGIVSLREDFCRSPWQGGNLSAAELADKHVCQFVCPCCAGGSPEFDCSDDDADDEEARRVSPNVSQALQQKWELEGFFPRRLFVVTDDAFHRTLMDKVTAKHTMEEFLEHHFSYSASSLMGMKQKKEWSDGELAIHIYTSNMLYSQLNLKLREATSMADIDDYWQSYVYHLGRGLEDHAAYGDVETWRGVRGIAPDEIFKAGDSGVLPSFASTSTVREVAFSFAGGAEDSAVFHFTGGGYDIQRYSAFPGEAELLLEPGRAYRVGSVQKVTCGSSDVNVVHLLTTGPKVLDRPDDTWHKAPALTCPKKKLPVCPVCSCCPTVRAEAQGQTGAHQPQQESNYSQALDRQHHHEEVGELPNHTHRLSDGPARRD